MEDKLRQMEDEMNRYNEQSLFLVFCRVLRGSQSYLIILHILNLFLCKFDIFDKLKHDTFGESEEYEHEI